MDEVTKETISEMVFDEMARALKESRSFVSAEMSLEIEALGEPTEGTVRLLSRIQHVLRMYEQEKSRL